MRILITGGAGYIGAHTVVALIEAGADVAIVDNFANSSPKAIDRIATLAGRYPRTHVVDLTDRSAVDDVIMQEAPEAVVHFAGLKAVGESVREPLLYYTTNLTSTLNLLQSMDATGVRRLVFSSSATVYGNASTPPFRETDEIGAATNPYGQTKVMIERILADISRADPSWRVAVLRYFNPIGAHPSGLLGEDPRDVPNNIAPYIAQVASGRLPRLTVHGNDYPTSDGTGERDYIHVQDLAQGHVAALNALATASGLHTWNLGTGRATSVLELIEAFRSASGKEIPYEIGDRREGDVAQAWADPSLAAIELGWSARHSVEEMALDAWNWQRLNPRGLRSEAVHTSLSSP